ncbi:hypothetical protein AJ80_00589 [Polytolypa hystricis UAMH7299]|uniref:Major facilitator superfamily (MFS) profile domain-containing protein n=1 Tax=Polytolypa hystricis (strain UAMH7299) TaxID=1447883 RepID=A0A2B7Z365_POLH7|nr:hypothetical protein AJ80_00589 [Polytolypa hystricis UAMH7299]
MFSNPIGQRQPTLAVCAVTVQAASGSMYMIAYGTYFFAMANIGNPFENTCILAAVGVAEIIANNFAISRFGWRRTFLMSGLAVCGITKVLIVIVYDKDPISIGTGKAIVALSVLYKISSDGAIAPSAWVPGGELPSQRLRSYTFGLASTIGLFFAWLTMFTTPYFYQP